MDTDMFSKISALLSDPEAGKKIQQLADNLGSQNIGASAPSGLTGSAESVMNGIIPAMNKPDKNVELLKAIIPYMRPERAEKINTAIKAMKILTLITNLK